MIKNFLTIIFLLCLCTNSLMAQINISFEQPDDFSACGTARFSVTISNDFAGVLEDVVVTIQVPDDCGITYQSNSVMAATESNINDLGNPSFSLANIINNGSHTFSFDLRASCAAVECINTGQTFNNIISVSTSLGGNAITPTPYLVATPLLVITNVSEVLMTGSKGDVLQRNITIQNTREGALSAFQLMDTHQGGMDINFNVGNPLAMSDMVAATELTGADFTQIGDGDVLFEFEESIVIQEQILITNCGIPQGSSASEIKVTWGCNDEICQSSMFNALVDFSLSELRPELTFEPITRAPLCFCGGTGDTQGMVISNNGTEEATDIILTIRQQITDAIARPNNGMDPTSFVIDSSGIETPIVPQTLVAYEPTDAVCDLPDSLFQTAFVRIPVLGVGETVSVFWELYHCNPNCSQPFIEWEYDFGYNKSCPPNPFISGGPIYVSEGNVGLDATLTIPPEPLEDQEHYTLSYDLSYPALDQTSGVLSVDVFVPCGLVWADNDMVLGGVNPSGLNVNELPSGTRILAEYDLPFSETVASMDFEMQFLCENLCDENEACRDSIVTNCPFVCTVVEAPTLLLGLTTSVNTCSPFPAQCGIQRCLNPSMLFDCGMDSICLNFIEGYFAYDTEVYRTNFGLADNDNDRIADPGGVINLDSIRRDRAMTGDTIEAVLQGEIVADIPDASFKYGLIDLELNAPSSLGEANLAALMSHTGIVPFNATLRVVDASTNNVYECENLMPLPNVGALYSYEVSPADLAAMSCAIPADFEYAQGDSVIFTAQYHVDYNLVKLSSNDLFPPIADVYFESNPYFYNTPILNKDETFTCGCTTERVRISGYEYKTFPGVYALPPCDTSEFVGAMLFKFDIGDGNFFPFEHRSLAEVTDFQIGIPDFIKMTEAKLTRFSLQPSVENNQEYFIKEQEPLVLDFNNGRYHFDFSTCQNPSLDEGFNFLLQYRFLTEDCKAQENYPLDIFSTINFAPHLLETINPLMDTLSTNAIRALRPNLFLEPTIANITSLGNQANWILDLINFPSNVTSSESGVANNVWIFPVSSTGDIDNFKLYNPITEEFVSQVNGVFQLGDVMANDTLAYQLIADNQSCITENVRVRYGWNCDLYTNPNISPCYEKTLDLTVISPPGEIEIIVDSPTAPNDLCDIVPYHSIEIFNAQLGAVFDVLLEGQLPPGLDLVAGSTQIAYPTGSDFINVADPIALGDNRFRWDISALNETIAMNGLSSFSLAPAHSVTLRFETATSCDFIAGAYIEFLARANQNCALPTNYLSEASEAIRITNVDAPYEAFLNANIEVSSCQDSSKLTVQATMTGTTDLRDSIFISLPPGVLYIPNSYVGVTNAPTEQPLLITGTITQNLRWILPEAIPAGAPIVFEIGLTGFQDLDCGIAPILIRTVAENLANCVISGEDCSILVETGSTTFDALIERPFFNLNNFNVEISPTENGNLVNYSIQVPNIGTVASDGLTVLDFYLDQDGNGVFSMGDELVASSSILEVIHPNEILVDEGSFEIMTSDYCQLIAVLNVDKNCVCVMSETPVNLPIVFNLPMIENVCSQEEISIGVPEIAGHTYEWLPSNNLSCNDCAMPIFSAENNGESAMTLSYTLIDDDNADCLIAYHLAVEVLPELKIVSEDQTICEGQSTNLVASSEAVTVLWQPGNFDEQIYTVSPTETVTYTATMIDAAACIHSDEVTVMISPSPSINAGEDRSFCGLETPMLNATINSDYQYQWSPAANLSNPAIPNPLILNLESTLFTLIVTDQNGCQSMDEVQIDFGETPDLSVSGTRMICLGNSSQLEATGGTDYQWSPATGLSCTDCPNPIATPEETTLYTVTASGTNGCMAIEEVLMTVTDGELLTFENRSTCANESVDIFGMLTNEAGNYFDTTEVSGGCLEIHRITLSVLDTSFEEVLVPIFCEGDTIIFEGQTFTEAGEFCFTFPSNSGCDSTICYLTEVVESPDVVFPSDVEILLGESVDLDLIINGDSTGYTFAWTPETGLSCTDCSNPTATPTETTVYNITVTDENACDVRGSITVTVSMKCEVDEVEIPNVFTPNSDGANDVFEVIHPQGGTELVEEMRVYNRWGQLVFKGSGADATWDGLFEGKRAPSDVYVYYVLVTCPEAERLLKGDVTLVR